jgi:predicted phage terminase large subunit-like protein
MSQFDREFLNLGLRGDLATFIRRSFQTVEPGQEYQDSQHIHAIAWRLEQCLRGDIKRLIITLPPRHLKSICASVAFPAWVLGQDPGKRIICASYSNELAEKHARDCRAVMERAWYREAFPETRLDPSKTAAMDFATTARGFRFTTSVGGTLTGRGGNIILVDDPLKAGDATSDAERGRVNDWFGSTLFSRLDNKAEDCIIIVMQRLHVDDLVGHLLKSSDSWTHLNLPATAVDFERIDLGDGRVFERDPGEVLCPAREPKESLEDIKQMIGSYRFSAQYQQNPIPIEGNLIKWKWFQTYPQPLAQQSGDFVTQSWDTASKAGKFNDYSVCTTWLRRGNDHHLHDVRRERLVYPELKRRVAQLAGRYHPDAVLIEDRSSGTQLIQDLREDGTVRPIAINPEADKFTRMFLQAAKLEAGNVFIPEQAPWLGDFRDEIRQFPDGRHDDQVDSMSQYLAWSVASNIDFATQSVVNESQFSQALDLEFGAQAWDQGLDLMEPF